jgi:hypothetical protein
VRFPLTEQLLREARAFELRAGCRDCFYWNAAKGECWHGWPDEGQRNWHVLLEAAPEPPEPPEAPQPVGGSGEVAFCKEFELR